MIEDKLKEIFDKNIELTGNIFTLMSDDAIAQIKQCFLEAGWKEPSTAVELTNQMARALEEEGIMENWTEDKVMTRQEFYDRFEKEMEADQSEIPYGKSTLEVVEWFHDRALEAARKAAGL